MIHEIFSLSAMLAMIVLIVIMFMMSMPMMIVVSVVVMSMHMISDAMRRVMLGRQFISIRLSNPAHRSIYLPFISVAASKAPKGIDKA